MFRALQPRTVRVVKFLRAGVMGGGGTPTALTLKKQHLIGGRNGK